MLINVCMCVLYKNILLVKRFLNNFIKNYQNSIQYKYILLF